MKEETPLYYVAVVPFNRIGQVLLGKRKEDSIWTTCAGGGHKGETPERTAVRECWEEAGLIIRQEQLQPLGVKEAPNGKPVHCFWCIVDQLSTHVKNDPDQEVSKWHWTSHEDFPKALSSEKNKNRLETINQAMLARMGLNKSSEKLYRMMARSKLRREGEEGLLKYIDTLKSKDLGLAERVYRAVYPGAEHGQDSKLGQNETPNMEKSNWLKVGTKVEMEHTKDEAKAKKIAQDHLNEDPDYYKDWDNKEKILFQPKAPLKKGGEGSGKKGHTTNKDNVVQLKTKMTQKPEDLQTRAQQHLKKLKGGAALEGAKTQSGKPIVFDMAAATAQGYTPEDHNDASNTHYTLAQKVQTAIDKHKAAGTKIPDEVRQIAAFHDKKFKVHAKEAQRIRDRQKKTEEDARNKTNLNNKMKKSVTQMGHHESPAIDTGKFTEVVENTKDSKLLSDLKMMMEGYDYGDAPRSYRLDKGSLTLAKVGEGEYTGFFTHIRDVEGGTLEDTEKMRIERITLPDLVTLLEAKELTNNVVLPPQLEEAEEAREVNEIEPSEEIIIPEPSSLDRKIQMLELINKLLS